ncbi:MAG: DUF3786 domain-containing protein [Spirochaetaceae bacterium]|jgi:hypothetical protein|nr:DUF3786 domain-containing protein [Spirochaetaceae bacterium]
MPQSGTNRKDWKELAEEHYSELYGQLDPLEAASRCNLQFDGKAFSLRLMGAEYRAAFPQFQLNLGAEKTSVYDESVRVLLLRYLCGGRWREAGGKQLSYNDIPWGALYFRNFEGRCIKRLERAFGGDLRGFSEIFETHESLRAERLAGKECGWRFEFLSGLYMSVIIWEGDDEFPAKAQILFDDNFPAAFSAEDIAVAGDICISRLKEMKDERRQIH